MIVEKLETVKVSAYGIAKTAKAILEAMTEEELEWTLQPVLEDLLQTGRYVGE